MTLLSQFNKNDQNTYHSCDLQVGKLRMYLRKKAEDYELQYVLKIFFDPLVPNIPRETTVTYSLQ